MSENGTLSKFLKSLSYTEEKLLIGFAPFRRVINFHPQTLSCYFASVRLNADLEPIFPNEVIAAVVGLKEKLMNLGLIQLLVPKESKHLFQLHPFLAATFRKKATDNQVIAHLNRAFFEHYELAAERFSNVYISDFDADHSEAIAFIGHEKENFIHALLIGATIGEQFIYTLMVLWLADKEEVNDQERIKIQLNLLDYDLQGTDRHLEWLVISYQLAYFYIQRNELKKAANIVGDGIRFLETLTESSFQPLRGTFLHLLGQVYNELGVIEKAETCFKQSAEVFSDTGDLLGQSELMISLAYFLQKQGLAESAMSTLDAGLNILGQDKPQVFQHISHFLQKGNVSFIQQDFTGAVDAYEACKELSAQSGDLSSLIGAWQGLGVANSGLENFQESTDCFNKAMELSLGQSVLEELELSRLLINMGNNSMKLEEYEEALDYFHKAHDKLVQPENQLLQAEVQQSIANAYFYLGDLEKSITYDTSALEAYLKLEHWKGVAWLLHNAKTVQIENPGLRIFSQFLEKMRSQLPLEMFEEILELYTSKEDPM